MLFAAMLQSVQGCALAIAKSVEEYSGFELWRRLYTEFEPESGARMMALLSGIITPTFEKTADFLSELEE